MTPNPVDAAKRRVSGPLDRTAFKPRRINLPPGGPSSELSRLSLYRLGLSGTYAKYRIVPRSAIVAYEDLPESARAEEDGPLRDLIAKLWQRHGAPSRELADEFLAAAAELDRSPEASTEARGQLVEAWLSACKPRSAFGRLRDNIELAVCFVLRRLRQWAVAVAARFSRPSNSTTT